MFSTFPNSDREQSRSLRCCDVEDTGNCSDAKTMIRTMRSCFLLFKIKKTNTEGRRVACKNVREIVQSAEDGGQTSERRAFWSVQQVKEQLAKQQWEPDERQEPKSKSRQ